MAPGNLLYNVRNKLPITLDSLAAVGAIGFIIPLRESQTMSRIVERDGFAMVVLMLVVFVEK